MPRASAPAVVSRDRPSVLELSLARRGTIVGIVEDATQDALLAGVDVVLQGDDGGPLGQTQTDATGWFRFEHLRAGGYLVVARPPRGYAAEVGETRVEVPPGGSVDAELRLRLAGVLRGSVRDEDSGTPLADVTVKVYDSSGRCVAQGRTGAAGEYEFSGLPEDRYEVRAFL